MADEANTRADQKRAAREAKQKSKAEARKNEERFEFEEYNIKKKAESREHTETAKKMTQAQKEAQAKAQAEKQQHLKKTADGPILKLSKPEPEMSPFLCFKLAHQKWDAEKLKEEWAKLTPEQKEEFKELSKKDKERYKSEMAEWQKNQEAKKLVTSGKKGRQG